MIKKHVAAGVSVLLLVLGFAPAMRAQSSISGAIVGTVTDKTGALIPGASVSAVNIATNASSSTTTDTNGRYVLSSLRPGRYTVDVTAKGFSAYKQENVTVEVGRSTSIDVTLKVAGQATTVVVTGEAPVVVTDRPDFSSTINTDFIANLPTNDRRWSKFALGTPGATADGNFGLISFRGISGLLNNNTVDGGDNNQAFFSEEKGRTRISYSVSEDSIQEFQVNTSNFSAEYGRAAGGVVNAVTKSGTNRFHGNAFWYYRDSDLGATTTLPIPSKPADKRHQFGGDIGGPIIPNKLFFFFSADQQLRLFPGVATPSVAGLFTSLSTADQTTLTNRGITAKQTSAALAFLNSLTGVVPRRGDELVMLPKIDWQINPSNHFSAEYNRMRWSSPGGIQTQGVVFRGIESFGDDFVKDDTAIGRLTTIFSPTVTNQFLFEYGRDLEFQLGPPPIPGEPVAPQSGISPQICIVSSSCTSRKFTFGNPDFLPRPAFPDEARYQFADTLSWSRGKHLVKFGTDINRVNDLQENLFEQLGAYSYSSVADFISDWVSFTDKLPPFCSGGCYNFFGQGFGPLGFEFTTWDLGFFANDDFRIAPRLTLTLGLRYDYERMPDPQIPNPLLLGSNTFPSDTNNLGPRLGFAWDLTGKGKTVLRGGYGIYYGRIINGTIFQAMSLTGVPGSQIRLSLKPGQPGAALYPNIDTVAPPANLSPPDVIVFGPNTQNPLIHEFDLVFEQEIARNTAVTISYLGSLGRNLPRPVDMNLSPPTKTITYLVKGGQFDGQSFTMPLFTGARPNPNFSRITNISSTVKSHYNALVVQLSRRMTSGLQVQASYTYARAFDDGQGRSPTPSGNDVFSPFELGLESARSSFDVRHRFSALVVWAPEYFKSAGTLARELLYGFTVAPIVSVSSGAPVTGSISGNAPSGLGATSFGINGSGGTNRPPWIPQNSFQAPRTVNVDLEVGKSFRLTEGWNFRIFADAFNLFNHVNPTSVNTRIFSAGGTKTQPTLTFDKTFLLPSSTSSTLGGPGQRQIQIGAKLTW